MSQAVKKISVYFDFVIIVPAGANVCLVRPKVRPKNTNDQRQKIFIGAYA